MIRHDVWREIRQQIGERCTVTRQRAHHISIGGVSH
ncbi:Uncharacterised protein [Vibrio cholerae]|nr:Uncharacterised protein [Vibrio cholerae]CSI60957.1 Uncharacterised protein [Vibrio cholerae]